MSWSANALSVLEARYLSRGPGGEFESPEALLQRVSAAVAAPEREHGGDLAAAAAAQRFFDRMAAREFLPNSPTLMNAGRPLGQLAACFVVPVPDTTGAIFDAVRHAALIQKTGGGTGFSFSALRPKGDPVASTGGIASGPVAFMQVFDVATEAVKQGGTRRGANMGILRVDHPDILDFISLKLDGTRMRNFNLSVAVTDEFMTALDRGEEYPLRNPRTGEVVRRIPASRVFELLCNAAWAIGDPGVVYLDRLNRANPTPSLGAIDATNPCGEQPLLAYESCTLGSVNVARFVAGGAIDWERLRGCVRDGVDFLDNVIDVNRYPLGEIGTATRATRKIGLGVMGFADALIALGISYDAPEAEALGEKLAAFLESESLARSRERALERGPFPAFAGSVWAAGSDAAPVRNATTTTVAPTGTISIIAGCSSGIEPLYAVAYRRNVLDGAGLDEFHPAFVEMAKAGGFWSDELAAEVVRRGRVRGLDAVPAEIQRLFPTAHDVSIDGHVRMQAAFQKYVHAAVSKTINLPAESSPADVAHAYRLAYELGCKGVTVYRDGSREGQVLSVPGAAEEPAQAASGPAHASCPECAGALGGSTRCRVCLSCGWSACG